MHILKIILQVIFCIVCITLTGIVLFQKGKVAGLSGAIGGASESYWGKNKARSMEGKLEKFTSFIAVLYLLLALTLSLRWF